MLSPKKVKFRKRQKGKMRGKAKGGTSAEFRRVRAAGDRLRNHQFKTDRSCPYRHDPSREEGRQDLDSNFS
jgi:ribosomal protein L16/L10AE